MAYIELFRITQEYVSKTGVFEYCIIYYNSMGITRIENTGGIT